MPTASRGPTTTPPRSRLGNRAGDLRGSFLLLRSGDIHAAKYSKREVRDENDIVLGIWICILQIIKDAPES